MPDTVINSSSDTIDQKLTATRHRVGAYDNAYQPDNVYGHAVALLARHRVKPGALHIDIGSGFGRIAEPLVRALGVDYLACDLDEDALASLAQRGFETHRLILDTEARIYQNLVEIIAGRCLASVSIIDTLEHLDDPAAAMRALSRIAGEYQAFVLISVPNSAHRDLGLRLLFGLWDYTETGILDHTHRVLFSDAVLRRMLAGSGLHAIDANDVKMASSDQAFPADHPALQSGTTLHRLLTDLRNLGDAFGSTNQLVRLCTAGPASDLPVFEECRTIPRPCLSVVIRSEGRQPDLLAEIMTCIAAQTVTDFEVLILGHGLDRPRQVSIEQVIFELPDWLRVKIRFLRIDHGNRTELLNAGFAAATGRYISVLDEGDVVFAHWAETLSRAASVAPGQILRGIAITQRIRRVEFNYATGIRAESGLDKPASDFDLVEHLRSDCSPLPGLAFPRGLYHHLHLVFDTGLNISASRDYLLRGAGLTGVTSVPAVIAIHRSFDGLSASGTAFERAKLVENFGRMAASLWPADSVRKWLQRLDEVTAMHEETVAEVGQAQHEAAELKMQIATMSGEISGLSAQLGAKSAELAAISTDYQQQLHALREILTAYGSTRWRLLAPFRVLGRLTGGSAARRRVASQATLSASQMHALAHILARPASLPTASLPAASLPAPRDDTATTIVEAGSSTV